jgi:hypothetical protein
MRTSQLRKGSLCQSDLNSWLMVHTAHPGATTLCIAKLTSHRQERGFRENTEPSMGLPFLLHPTTERVGSTQKENRIIRFWKWPLQGSRWLCAFIAKTNKDTNGTQSSHAARVKNVTASNTSCSQMQTSDYLLKTCHTLVANTDQWAAYNWYKHEPVRIGLHLQFWISHLHEGPEWTSLMGAFPISASIFPLFWSHWPDLLLVRTVSLVLLQ